ncbi:MAG: ComEA family DNA-binding protein [Anaerolineae bacterium]
MTVHDGDGAFRAYAAVVLLNLAALGLVVRGLRSPTAGAVMLVPPPTPTPLPSSTPAPTATPAQVVVYVSGAVARPRVVRLRAGARVADAVAAAGGFGAAAADQDINLAAVVQDGQQLHVPARGQAPTPAPGLHGGGPNRSPAAAAGETSAGAAGRVDINSATAAQLEALPGIGPALAGRIVARREEHGPFSRPEDLLEVPGIGSRTLARLADMIRVR